MNSYKIKILKRSSGNLSDIPCMYIMSDIKANSEEKAVEEAKKDIAENGNWSINMNIEERISHLILCSVEINKRDI